MISSEEEQATWRIW